MLRLLHHRGPDGDAVWASSHCGLGLARLAITAPHTATEVFSAGAVRAVANGEIDNHRSLRRALGAGQVPSPVDTAVVPALFAARGPALLADVRGPLAAAVWDGRQLHGLRDAFGKKPLFMRALPSGVRLASEQKALFFDDTPRVDPGRAARFLVRGFLDDDEPLFQGVQVLPPGCHVRIDARGTLITRVAPLAARLRDGPVTLEALEGAFERAVKRRLRPEVGGVSLLSGGIDSALVAQAAGLPTITVAVPGRSEAEDARRRARRLRLPHQTLDAAPPSRGRMRAALRALETPDVGGAWELAPALLDLAQRLASDGVKVAFSGEGADELFLGYPWQRLSLALSLLWSLPSRDAELTALLPAFARERLAAPRARAFEHWRRAAEAATRTGARDAVAALLPDVVPDEAPGPAALERQLAPHPARALQLDALERDMQTLPVLHADRLMMAHGVEARLPFLDLDLARLALRLPLAALADRRFEKPTLRALAGRRLGGTSPRKRGMSGAPRPDDEAVLGWASEGLRRGTQVVDGAALSALVKQRAAAVVWRALLLEETAAVVAGDAGWAS